MPTTVVKFVIMVCAIGGVSPWTKKASVPTNAKYSTTIAPAIAVRIDSPVIFQRSSPV